MRPRAIHQVVATLAYGDAIGNEVLGIQRVLRDAGYASEIFVETAEERLEPLTRDYRELVDASRPDNLLLHHFSIGSKASRTAFALPDIATQRKRLTERQPRLTRVTMLDDSAPEDQDIDAGIGPAG